MTTQHGRRSQAVLFATVALLLATALSLIPWHAKQAYADEATPTPSYQTLDELAGARFAYVNGSVYNQAVQAEIDGTTETFYPSLAECVAAVEAGKADAAVQLSYCCQLAVNRRPETVALLPQPVKEVSEGFFFTHGSPLAAQFNDQIDQLSADGTLADLEAKWVAADDSGKTLPEQDWDAPKGTLKFVTSGVIEPFSYVGEGGVPMGYDVELALTIARNLGYHLEISTLPMDSIFAAVSSGKADFGGTLTQTPEREEACDFSKPVMPTTISVIVAAEGGAQAGAAGTLEYSSLSELADARFGDVSGSAYPQMMGDYISGVTEGDFQYFAAPSDVIAALLAHKVDVCVTDDPVAQLAVSKNEGLGIISEPVFEAEYAFFFQKDSPLTAQFSEVIEGLEADGTLDELKAKWCGADDSAKTIPDQDWDAPNGTLTMVTRSTYEPMSYLANGQIVGYDIEVALICARELGYHLKLMDMIYEGAMSAVISGKADFYGGGCTVTPERSEKVDFASPSYHGAAVAIVRMQEGGTGGGATSFFSGIADSFRKTFVEEKRWQLILSGLGVTLVIAVASGMLGTLLGYGTVLARRGGSRLADRLVSGYQSLMGGVPLVVVLMVLYYVVFGSIDIAGEIVAILAFTLAFGATSGSTMWTAVSSLDAIQEECGLALGYTSAETFRKIIFPQAAQQFLPQLMGQFVSLLKDTAIVGYIAVQDLTRASDLIRARTMDAFFPLISTAIIYYIACRLLAWALGRLTAKFDIRNRPRTIEGVEL